MEFNLEKALAGDKVVTRGGLEVTELKSYNVPKGRDSLCGIRDGDRLCTWKSNGMYVSGNLNSVNDLFMQEDKSTSWTYDETPVVEVPLLFVVDNKPYTGHFGDSGNFYCLTENLMIPYLQVTKWIYL